MTGRPALVLVHGGQHTARCWDPTVVELARQAPALRVLVAELPGRGSTAGELATLTVQQCVSGVVQQIEKAGVREVVLVGHSLAGVVLPGVAARLGAERVHRLVMVACCVPPQGRAIADTLSLPLRVYVRRAARTRAASKPLPRWLAAHLFCNGMSREQKAFVLDQLCAEAMSLNVEAVDRTALPARIRRTWVLTRRDRALRPAQQRQFAENLGGVDTMIELDAGHDVMVSDPVDLAAILIDATEPQRVVDTNSNRM